MNLSSPSSIGTHDAVTHETATCETRTSETKTSETATRETFHETLMHGTVWEAMIDLLAPRFCAGCGVHGEVLCPSCRKVFSEIQYRRAPAGLISCGVIYSCAMYEGEVRHTILQWKDHGDREVGHLLARFMCGLVERVLPDVCDMPVALVPVPSSRESVHRRGRVHLREITEPLVRSLRRRDVRAQSIAAITMSGHQKKSVAQSHAHQRAQRSHSAFQLSSSARRLADFPVVILVDDICTTGSTLLSCARLLTEAGHKPLCAVTLASVITQKEKHMAEQNVFHRTVFE